MSDASRLQLLFQLHQLLAHPPAKSAKVLARRLGIGERRAYRLIEELEKIGLVILKEGTTYRLQETEAGLLSQTFNAEEAALLHELVSRLPDRDLFGSSQRDALLAKLAPIASGVAAMGLLADRARLVHNMRRLQTAIDEGFQVQLFDYQSAHSASTRDRTLEPLALLPDLELLIGFEVAAGRVKGFKLGRIGSVGLTSARFIRTDRHAYNPPDVFGFLQGDSVWQAELRLHQRSWLQFQQQFPVAARQATPQDTSWHLALTIYDIRPLAMFIFSYLDDLEVLGDAAFLRELKHHWQHKADQLASSW